MLRLATAQVKKTSGRTGLTLAEGSWRGGEGLLGLGVEPGESVLIQARTTACNFRLHLVFLAYLVRTMVRERVQRFLFEQQKQPNACPLEAFSLALA